MTTIGPKVSRGVDVRRGSMKKAPMSEAKRTRGTNPSKRTAKCKNRRNSGFPFGGGGGGGKRRATEGWKPNLPSRSDMPASEVRTYGKKVTVDGKKKVGQTEER